MLHIAHTKASGRDKNSREIWVQVVLKAYLCTGFILPENGVDGNTGGCNGFGSNTQRTKVHAGFLAGSKVTLYAAVQPHGMNIKVRNYHCLFAMQFFFTAQ